MRLLTRNGHDWSDRYPLITEAALRNRNSSFVIDGEAVLLGVDGRSDFNGLHSRRHDAEVEFYAFDILVSDGEDLRKLPLTMRKANLARLLARRVDGIFLSRLRAGRDRPGPVPPRLPDGAGGHGLQASRQRLSRRPVPTLDQGQEPAASGVQQGSGSVLKQRRHWRMRRFEVPEDNGFIAECVRLLGLRIRHQRQLADRVPAGTHRGDGDQTRSRASQTMEDISHASWDDAEEKDKP